MPLSPQRVSFLQAVVSFCTETVCNNMPDIQQVQNLYIYIYIHIYTYIYIYLIYAYMC